ncbi:MAG: hypothetical protein NTX53_08870 [candidate division WOR-3 bacterium]|nr:hypothetical protein [candidate division WOR-3 bacterium]
MVKIVRFALALAALASISHADWVAIGPDGGIVNALALDRQNPATLYALPYEYPDNPRVFQTADGGAGWTSVGRLPDYNVTALRVDPHQSDYLYGMTSSGVWRSTDGGASWASYSLPASAMGITTDPLVPGRLFVSGYSYSTYAIPVVMISTNYGQSWSSTTLDPDTGYSYCAAFDPTNTGIAYAGCANGLVFRTTDGGAHWVSASGGLPVTTTVQGLAVNAGNPNIVLAAASDGVYRTTDAGGSWARAGEIAMAFDVALTPANPALAYCLGYDSVPRLFVSTDSGATWSVQPGNVQQSKGGSLITDPSAADVIYSPGAAGVVKTTDRGAHWAPANSGIRIATISTMSTSPWTLRGVYVECYQNGVFRSTDLGTSWQRCTDFLSCGAICGIGLAPGGGTDTVYALEGSG